MSPSENTGRANRLLRWWRWAVSTARWVATPEPLPEAAPPPPAEGLIGTVANLWSSDDELPQTVSATPERTTGLGLLGWLLEPEALEELPSPTATSAAGQGLVELLLRPERLPPPPASATPSTTVGFLRGLIAWEQVPTTIESPAAGDDGRPAGDEGE